MTIDGTLPSTLVPGFIALIEQEGVSTALDGDPFAVGGLPERAALDLLAHEVAGGRFEALEAFCVNNALPFSRWSGAHPGQWGAGRVIFSGGDDNVTYAADDDDTILIGRCTATRPRQLCCHRRAFRCC